MLRLRVAVNAVRAAANLLASVFTDQSLAGVVVKRAHLVEIRVALDAARQALGLPPASYTDPVITAGATLIRAAHWLELRSGMH